MNSVIEGLEPGSVWHHFYQISQIPRCSGNEKSMGEYVVNVARKNNLAYKIDDVGNIIVYSPASAGYEDRSSVVLQGHMDMVCEKNKDTVHDFSKDPLQLKKEGEWLSADGTTLGADNGIGLCYALALMDEQSIPHGPLEFLFTVDEETGLTGASELKPGFINSKCLINLDSEEEGEIFIGCAGGQHTILKKKIIWEESPGDASVFKIKISGLRGGHSGLNIHEGLGNSIKLLSRYLYFLEEEMPFHLACFEGGSKHNAIPREADAIVIVSNEYTDKLNSFNQRMQDIIKNELLYSDKDVFIKMEKAAGISRVFTADFQKVLIRLLYSIPHGVINMSNAVPGLVETSTNMAVVEIKNDTIEILTSQRSSVRSAIYDIAGKIKSLGELTNFDVEQGGGYAPWQPNPDSALLKMAIKVYKDITGNEPEVKAVHAGLECGIIGEQYPDMDMISFGPTILGAHSPEERVEISSVANVWHYLLEVLKTV